MGTYCRYRSKEIFPEDGYIDTEARRYFLKMGTYCRYRSKEIFPVDGYIL